jgi:hypothetical protein
MKRILTRRDFTRMTAAAAAVSRLPRAYGQGAAQPAHVIAPGPFKATWEYAVTLKIHGAPIM